MIRNVLWLCLVSVCLVPLASAQAPGQRQYYAAWTKHSTKPYYYRNYYYKKTVTDTTYTYHYGIYYPSRGKRVYMYNPHTRKYWGAWEGNKYSLLAKDKQKSSLDEIAAEDFPPPAAPPTIPGIDDPVAMLPPPSDFPKLADDTP